MIIAYNLCFSTCLGRPAHAAAGDDPPPKLGAVEYGLPAGSLAGRLAPERLVVAPNGVAFVPREARPGVLPRLLSEILNTRIMVGWVAAGQPCVCVCWGSWPHILPASLHARLRVCLFQSQPLPLTHLPVPSLHASRAGQGRHEALPQVRQGAAALPECAPVWAEAHRKRDVRLHGGGVLGWVVVVVEMVVEGEGQCRTWSRC